MRARWFPALLALTLAPAGMAAVAEPPATSPLQLVISRTDGPRNLVWGFFDETTGNRVARLQVGLTTLDYGRQGAFRVAWRPRAVLQQVDLRITDAAAWPGVCGQLADMFKQLAGRQALVIRDMTITVSNDPGGRIQAASAELSREGNLVLHEVTFPARPAPNTVARLELPLRGPQAGTITTLSLPPLANAAGSLAAASP